jgi:nitrate reductase delta subunit
MQDLNDLLGLFADLLEYPFTDRLEQAQEYVALLDEVCPPAAEKLERFQQWVKHERLGRVQEVYTSTFDLQGVCCPYIGHQLFGESYQRSWFMARLNEGYHDRDFDCGGELPDHLVMVLRFLSRGSEDEFSQVLIKEGLVPALEKMVQVFGDKSGQPYRLLLEALSLLLQDQGRRGEFSLELDAVGGVGDA